MKRIIACTLSMILLYPAIVAVSQTNSGSMSGIVVDVLGIVIPKAKVWATRRSDQSASFETRTDDSGKFSFTNLPPDVYQVTVSQNSGATTEKTVSVAAGRMAQLEIQFSSGCDNVPEGSVSDDDKAEVLRATLIQGTAWGLLNPEQRETSVILSTKNIKRDWLQGLEGVSIQLRTPDEIQRKADDEGDFQFVEIPEIKVRRQCIAVTLSNTWAKGKRSRSLYMSGGVLIYEYRKESGKWVGKFTAGGII